jgi:hypothetical protein
MMMLLSNETLFSRWAIAAIIAGACPVFSQEVTAAEKPDSGAGVASGRWASNDNVSMSGSAKAGSRFFLEIVVSGDGSFKGSWEHQRTRKAEPASGRLDAAARTGQVELKGLGKTSFKFKTSSNQKGQPQLDIEMPRDWMKQGEPVLYETSLNPKSR